MFVFNIARYLFSLLCSGDHWSLGSPFPTMFLFLGQRAGPLPTRPFLLNYFFLFLLILVTSFLIVCWVDSIEAHIAPFYLLLRLIKQWMINRGLIPQFVAPSRGHQFFSFLKPFCRKGSILVPQPDFWPCFYKVLIFYPPKFHFAHPRLRFGLYALLVLVMIFCLEHIIQNIIRA